MLLARRTGRGGNGRCAAHTVQARTRRSRRCNLASAFTACATKQTRVRLAKGQFMMLVLVFVLVLDWAGDFEEEDENDDEDDCIARLQLSTVAAFA